ncbi:MAG: pyrroline-5-carboxylate reductase [Zymomonas mobilis]|uniref:Pyrroline-5-carboxylate reductase n=1 Tax=Zymomonas mobilis TaxID=542 RepID=A0A542VZR8_ZYMMB|nr:pyrroline-5-carboxylate reductase [Zymomonas mobilis]TQL16820.1 pyrroline-5-carboxylate reductase [Zymomonas mobilis]
MSHIHFIGSGQMSEAMIRAIIKHKTASKGDITAYDIRPERKKELQESYGITAFDKDRKNIEAIKKADIIVIGVRPQDDLKAVGADIAENADKKALVVSIVAGVTLAQLESLVGSDYAIARIIPNTLTDTGLGYSGVVINSHADKDLTEKFVSGFGKALFLDESLIDIFTGFGVCGPNYVYYFIEALVDAGVLAGLPRDIAWKTTMENLVGSVKMLELSGKHPRQLLDINNSPAGVGMNSLFALNQSDFTAGLQKSVLAAVKRTTELGQKKD